MTVSTGSLPRFATLTNNVLYFNPTMGSEGGTHQISVTVTDPASRAITGTISVYVQPNQAPQLANPPTTVSIWTLVPFSFLLQVTDAEQNPLSYEIKKSTGDPLPSWITWDTGTQTLSGTPANDDIPPRPLYALALS